MIIEDAFLHGSYLSWLLHVALDHKLIRWNIRWLPRYCFNAIMYS
uniref:Uncharacterized protein n=1 Tax=Arundo donax TaxID=35708 RepID=A0A0A9C7S8_ARUDO